MLATLVALLSTTTFADSTRGWPSNSSLRNGHEYTYTCTSGTNLKIFSFGKSQNITIELNSGYLSIDNKSGIWNSLIQVDELDGAAYFNSFSTDSALETLGLVAIADTTMLDGASEGQLILIKDIATQALTQEYSCKLNQRI